jgi:hypothetical protein
MQREGRPCGAPQHPVFPDRCAKGHADMRALGARTAFKPGELQAIQHGLRSKQGGLPPEFAHLAADIDAFVQGSLADEGGAAEVSVRRLAQINYRARLHRRILQIDAAIELHGLFDKRGKLRVAWLSTFLSFVNTAKSQDQMLGLERRPKRVQSLAEVLNGDDE